LLPLIQCSLHETFDDSSSALTPARTKSSIASKSHETACASNGFVKPLFTKQSKQTWRIWNECKLNCLLNLFWHSPAGMLQAWVAHFATPLKRR
jgi:hypothetical protein